MPRQAIPTKVANAEIFPMRIRCTAFLLLQTYLKYVQPSAPDLRLSKLLPAPLLNTSVRPLLLHRNPQRFHLAIQMAALQAQHLRCPRDVAVALIQFFQDVIALIGGAGLWWWGKPRRRRSSAFTMDQWRQVLAFNLVRRRIHDDQPFNYVAQLADISRPGIAGKRFNGFIRDFARPAAISGGKFF